MCTISVIMSIYSEKEEWIKESIDSILNQTFSDFEFIIINDNPNRDNNKSLLAKYAQIDNRIIVITNEENVGLTKSLNKGLKIAKGKYIARMDADDISLPTRFQKQVDFLEKNPEYIVCGTNIYYFGETKMFLYSDWIKLDNDAIKAQLIFNSCFAHPTVMIRRDILLNHNIFYDENYKQAQDYRLWEELYNFGKYKNLEEKLLKYRISFNQVSNKNNSNQVFLGQKIRRRIIQKWLNSINILCDDNNLEKYIKIENRDFIIRKAIESNTKKCYIDVFLNTLYFSGKSAKTKLIYYFYFKGDFLRFNLKTNLRFIALICNLKKTIVI